MSSCAKALQKLSFISPTVPLITGTASTPDLGHEDKSLLLDGEVAVVLAARASASHDQNAATPYDTAQKVHMVMLHEAFTLSPRKQDGKEEPFDIDKDLTRCTSYISIPSLPNA